MLNFLIIKLKDKLWGKIAITQCFGWLDLGDI